MTNETYLINITVGINIIVERLQYSMIIFDEADVLSSNTYFLVYYVVEFTSNGGFIPVPAEFTDNFIMGFLEFTSDRTRMAITFTWDFATVNGTHGVQMPVTVGRSPLKTFNNITRFTVFYMKTWLCPNDTYINLTSNMCECSLQGCLLCFWLAKCTLCDTFNNYWLDSASGLC